MLNITHPPKIELHQVWSEIIKSHSDQISAYLQLSNTTDNTGRYLPYDKMQYHIPKELDKNLAWAVIKLARRERLTKLFPMGDELLKSSFVLTPNIQKALSETDRNTTTAVLEWMANNVGEQHYIKYLLKDLIEDESISSSQLEGAATTTLAAKNMLNKKRKKPRTMDEKMILGNFKMMKFAWEKRHEVLSVDFIRDLHRIGVEDIDDKKYCPGKFRTDSDNVVVTDVDDDIVYTPPKADGIENRLTILVNWANKCHDDATKHDYIHPLVKAIILHFSIGYEHPFKDGNGRVARALFYWFMFKNNYSAFRYIAISTLLKSAAKKYGMSYIHSEVDQLDLTYFIEYQCKTVVRGIHKFKESYAEARKNIESFDKWIRESGLINQLNDKQKILLNVAKNKLDTSFNATNVSEMLGCSYNTASSTLNGLVALKIFRKKKKGREWTFSMLSTKGIRDNFKD